MMTKNVEGQAKSGLTFDLFSPWSSVHSNTVITDAYALATCSQMSFKFSDSVQIFKRATSICLTNISLEVCEF